MKNTKMTKIIAFTLALAICFGSIIAYAAVSAETSAPETAYMKRITASELPFEFVVSSYEDDTVTLSYNRTLLLIAINEKMFISDAETGKSTQNIDGTFTLQYNKVYKFSYQYESKTMKYNYDGEVYFTDSIDGPQVNFENILLNSYAEESSHSGTTISPAGTASAGVKYETESNDTYYTADVTYDDYDNYGTISSASDFDWWRITFASAGEANFWLGEIPENCDYDLMVYDSTGTNIVGGSVSVGNSSELISGLSVSAGTYYVNILWGDGAVSEDYYKLRVKWYPKTYTWTFNIYDNSTLSRISGVSSVAIRGKYDNYNVTISNGYGTVSVTSGREVGYNVRADGYLSYVSAAEITVSGDSVFNVYMTSANGLAAKTGFTKPFDSYYISSPFGWRSWGEKYTDNGIEYQNFDKHNGVDMPKNTGTVIKSICDVTSGEFESGVDTSMGCYVKVKDKESYYTIRYMHMRERFFSLITV